MGEMLSRNDILREIAKIADPAPGVLAECVFCGCNTLDVISGRRYIKAKPHANGCLWRIARETVKVMAHG